VDAFYDKIYVKDIGVIQSRLHLSEEEAIHSTGMMKSFEVLVKLAHIFFLVSKMYIINCYFRWPPILGDKRIIARLYSIALSTMYRIQRKLFEVMPIQYDRDARLIQLLITDTHSLDILYFRDLLDFFSSHNLKKEFEPIMNFLWKFGFDLIIDVPESLKIKINDRNWRAILAA
jgi:hypothetical protein